MIRLFGKKKRGESSKRQGGSATRDENETIVINLTGEDKIDPGEVRVEFDSEADAASAGPAVPERTSPTQGAAQAPGHAAEDSRRSPEPLDPRRVDPPQVDPPQVDPPLGAPSLSDDLEAAERTQIWTAGGPDSRLEPRIGTEVAKEVSSPRAEAGLSPDVMPAGTAPKAGLLMIIEGKSRGTIFGVNLGRNKLGRGPDNEIRIDNGDDAISRSNHAVIAADPKTRKIFLVPGDSTNLTYLNEAPLLEAKEIEDKATIQLGDTKMILIQILGNYVDWS